MCTLGIQFSDASDVLKSDVQDSLTMCEQCKNEVQNTHSRNLLPNTECSCDMSSDHHYSCHNNSSIYSHNEEKK